MCEKVPVQDKMLWSVRETTEMTGLGVNHVYRIAKEHPELVFRNGKRNVLIIRNRFQEFVENSAPAVVKEK